MSVATKIYPTREGAQVHRHSQLSGANAIQTINIPIGGLKQILYATVLWSASATKDVVFTLDSGLGSGYDTIINTLTVTTGTDGIWLPTAEIIIGTDDIIKCVAEAGGVAITSALAVYFRTL